MKQFIYKTLLFIMPIMFVAGTIEYLYRQIPNDYSYKNQYLADNAQNIEILVLGSSHGFRDIDPAYFTERGFNAAHVSQSLNYDYSIFNKYKNELHQLKWVIIPVSYFTLFSILEDGKEHWRATSYSIYYDSDVNPSLRYQAEIFNNKPIIMVKQIIKYIRSNMSYDRITVTELGYGLRINEHNKIDLISSGIKSAARHTKQSFRRLSENIDYLKKLINESESKGVKVFLFTPPAWSTYRDNLSNNQMDVMTSSINSITGEYPNVSYKSFMHDPRFVKSDYRDADHLNVDGAKKLTVIIDNIINSRE